MIDRPLYSRATLTVNSKKQVSAKKRLKSATGVSTTCSVWKTTGAKAIFGLRLECMWKLTTLSGQRSLCLRADTAAVLPGLTS